MSDTVKQRDKTHFLKDIERLAAKHAPKAFSTARHSGASAFQALAYPDSSMETWRHTNVAPLLNIPWASLIEAPENDLNGAQLRDHLPPLDMPLRLVFVDGFYRADLSRTKGLPARAHIGGIANALNRETGATLQQLLDETPAPRHVFSALNNAFLQDGPFIHIPDNCIVDTPIHIVYVSGVRPPRTAAHWRTIIALGNNAQAQVVQHHIALPGNATYFNNHVEEIRVGPNASLNRTEIILEREQGYRMAIAGVTLGRDSRFSNRTLTLDGGAITRNEMTTTLTAPHAEAQLHGLCLNCERGLVDNDLRIAHLAPHCASRMRYKGVLDGSSRTVFRGMVYVAKDAQKTDSQQLTANLTLSRQARIDAKPQLEIYADDVKCTHGATVGGPPEEQVYYLRSRGIAADRARAMLTYGFAGDVAALTPDAPTRKYLMDYLYDKLRPDSR